MEYPKNTELDSVLVTGGAGYVGAALVPWLLDRGYSVTVLDTFWYGVEVFDSLLKREQLTLVEGDLRDKAAVKKALEGCDCVIHLACISNDPSFDLQPDLGRSINLDTFRPLIRQSKDAGVKRFIYASSSSVYGVKDKSDVVEDDDLEPLTDYSIFKAECEKILDQEKSENFVTVTVRPATVCGYSPRQRLDVVVNILTNLAINTGQIKVFGGSQLRPNIHIDDMCRIYLMLLSEKKENIHGEIFNAGYENHSVLQLAEMVKTSVGPHVDLVVEETDDNRSYHVSSKKIQDKLGFVPSKTIQDAINELVSAFEEKKLTNTLTSTKYFNIKRMQELNIK